MTFQYFALLDRFGSDDNELDLSYRDRTLKIRKIPRGKLEDYLLRPKSTGPSINATIQTAIVFGENRYWIDYHYEVEDSKEAKIRANNAVYEEMEKMLLVLRLFKEGHIRIVFNFWRVPHGWTQLSSLKFLRSDERPYFLKAAELPALKNFREESSDALSDEKRTTQTVLDIALRRFTDGYERIKLEDRIIDYMIGLEALYLQGEIPSEMSYKLAHRMSVLLADNKEQRQKLFRRIKDSYKLRSHIVHGLKYELKQDETWFVEDQLRLSIKKFLKTPKPNWVNLIF